MGKDQQRSADTGQGRRKRPSALQQTAPRRTRNDTGPEDEGAVLQALRHLGQAAVRENVRDRLIRQVCDILVTSRGYRTAWITLLDENQTFVCAAQSGVGEEFEGVVQGVREGRLPGCAQQALGQSGVVAVQDPQTTCGSFCGIAAVCGRVCTLSVRLKQDETTFGVLTVSLPDSATAVAADEKLLGRVADDLTFALVEIELRSKHLEAELALRESEARYRALFESALDVVFCVGRDGRFQTANAVAARDLGMTSDEIVGKHMNDLFPPEIAARQLSKIMEVFETGQPFREHENITRVKDGQRWYNTNLTPIRDHEGAVRAVLGICRDITDYKRILEEKRRLEDRLRQAQKMEAIGRLAGGVAHDFNNLLTAILGYSQLLLRHLPKEDRSYRHAFEITRSAERAATLTDSSWPSGASRCWSLPCVILTR